MTTEQQSLLQVLSEDETRVVDDWLTEVTPDPIARRPLQAQAVELHHALRDGLKAGGSTVSLEQPAWESLRAALDGLSRSRAEQGKTAGDTSLFVLALKKPLFAGLQRRLSANPAALVDALWSATTFVDRMAQRTVTVYQQTREEIIRRQQQELLELSTPVIKLWDGVLAVPMIGTLDSSRTQIVMETLLQKIVDTESGLAIIDITGVPTVDTLVAQHLLKTVSAIRLMGADCIISGIRPQIAQTIVHLGIDLEGISTKSTLADALALALTRTGYRITRDK
jgi:rsbT co-antagonist protein RsbR